MENQGREERRARYEAALAGTRWLWTLMLPLMLVAGVTEFMDHDRPGEWLSCFNILLFTLLTIRAWLFKNRLDKNRP